MYSKLIALCFLLVCSACGEGQESDINCDFQADGICYVLNDYNIDLNNLAWVVENSQSKFPGLDLSALAEEHGLIVGFVSPKSMPARGIYYSETNEIAVHIIEDEPATICQETFYVFGHELLHFIARYYLEVSNEDNANHDVPGIFFGPDVRDLDTIEFWIYVETARRCGFSLT